MTHPLTLGGAHSSPYSLKMRAVLRYRHIPFRWVLRHSKWDDLPPVSVPVIPVIVFPDENGDYGEAMVDSSPQITRLEAEYGGRSLVPSDPTLAFIDFLLEDFADEWVTKMMYHYRWTYEADIEKSGRLLPLDRNLQIDDAEATQLHDWIIERQVGRRALVGSTEANQPMIEESYRRVLDLLQQHLGSHDFLLGDRPGRGDFALYGQLKPMLWWDPTPMAIAVQRAPKAVNWVERVDDLSWWRTPADAPNDGWFSTDALSPAVHGLLAEAGRTYAPFMLANAAALEAGEPEVVSEIDGQDFRQAPFKYQGKCLAWIRDEYGTLDDTARAKVDSLLAGTGCEALMA